MNDNILNRSGGPEIDQLEFFIDGLMSDTEAEQFLASCGGEQFVFGECQLQGRIDDALRRSFGFNEVEKDTLVRSTRLEALLAQASDEAPIDCQLPPRSSWAENGWVKLAIAVGLLFAIGMTGWLTGGFGRTITPHFQPRSLARIYRETTEAGFRPYYSCKDEQRFANTFEFRHGTPLALAELPLDSRMLGLSCLGGISRSTTAMLAEVDGEKAIVFVDRAANRSLLSVAAVSHDPDLNVFVVERDGLIFCEVSPLDSPALIEFLEVAQ